MPFFSVVIPTYNRAELISKAISSVLNQSFIDWELIIVDDGSTDNTHEIVSQFKDNRIKYIYQKNAERSAARNNGIQHAIGQYICFLDSDDYYKSNRLNELYNYITSLAVPIAMFYTGISFEDATGKITNRPEKKLDPKTKLIDYIAEAIIGTPQTCIHKNILSNHRFNIQFDIGEDMELWFRIINEYPLYYIDSYTVVALDHVERSVNNIQGNNSSKMLKMLQYALNNKDHPGSNARRQTRRQILSNCYFGIAKEFIHSKKKYLACYYLIKSIIKHLNSPQLKYRLNLVFNCVFNLKKAQMLLK